jgi:hypothetical protein
MLARRQVGFGANDSPICPRCGTAMQLKRRTPHPLYGYDYELQSFACQGCGREIHRSADAAGLPHHRDAGTGGMVSLQ